MEKEYTIEILLMIIKDLQRRVNDLEMKRSMPYTNPVDFPYIVSYKEYKFE